MPSPKNIIITGASSGIGSALALAYAASEINLGLIGRDKNRLAEITQHCQKSGAIVDTKTVDVTQTAELTRWIEDFDARHPVDLIVANAGITSCIEANNKAESWETMKKVFDVNLYGVLSSVSPLIEPMRRRKQGQIALMSSLGAYRGLPLTPAYCSSKAAVKIYGEALRGLLANDGVAVSVICPGFVKSPMSDKFPGPKPFIISPERAAIIIKKGLAKNRARISFPFPLNLGAWLLNILPSTLADWFISNLHYGRISNNK